MKTFVLTTLSLTVAILLGYFLMDMWKFADGVKNDAVEHDHWLKENTATYSVEIPAIIDTISIVLKPGKIIHLLKLPTDSVTSVYIYDTVLSFPISYPDVRNLKPLFAEQNSKDDSIIIDISGVTPKNYTLLYSSVIRKGYYTLRID